MSSDMRMFTVDRFLGLRESGDGDTELEMGTASKMENFFITDDYNLRLRPGAVRFDSFGDILGVWSGSVGGKNLLVVCDFQGGADRITCIEEDVSGNAVKRAQSGALGLTAKENSYVSIFDFGGDIYLFSAGKCLVYGGKTFTEAEAYIPTVFAGASPAGGGTSMERINLLSRYRKITYSADGESTGFVLPPEAAEVTLIGVDGESHVPGIMGSFDPESQTFTFTEAPVKGVGNVEITYGIDAEAAETARMQIIRCRLHESYNGSTDTRLFAAGNGTNLCYYTSPTLNGETTAMYFPALNEVSVDISASEITGLRRHYSKLLVFKQDETFCISYEPVTLTDGTTTAGFYLRSVNDTFGCDAVGQVQTVNNYPRTLNKGGVYEWRLKASFARDERYAVLVSDAIGRTLQDADLRKAVTFDDGVEKTYYVFLNDAQGTVAVNRYELGKDGGLWLLYRGEVFRNVTRCVSFGKKLVFFTDTEAFTLSRYAHVDALPKEGSAAIPAIWVSGNMSFGADFRRKYSSYLYFSILPQASTKVTVTAETDRRGDYLDKETEISVFDWLNTNFRTWTFATNNRPSIHRVRLKVKKFIYYKVIIKITEPGAVGTVLGFDQQIRYASMAK